MDSNKPMCFLFLVLDDVRPLNKYLKAFKLEEKGSKQMRDDTGALTDLHPAEVAEKVFYERHSVSVLFLP